MTELIVDEDLENQLEHYGIKGMRWGIRRDSPSGSHPSAGGSKTPLAPSEDHARVTEAQAKIRAGGTKTLSNQELQAVVTRMNLEQQYSRLASSPSSTNSISSGQKFVREALGVGKTLNEVNQFARSPVGKALRAGLKGDVPGIAKALAETGKKKK